MSLVNHAYCKSVSCTAPCSRSSLSNDSQPPKEITMGVNVSKDQEVLKTISKRIDEELKLEQQNNANIIKLLLLGTAECGKSTVLKQMKILHMIGFNETEIAFQRSVIFSNIIGAMVKMLRAMATYGIAFDDLKRQLDAEMVLEVGRLTKDAIYTFDLGLASALKKLWHDKSVQVCFVKGNEYDLLESTKYFFDNIDRIFQPDYIPNEQDILRSRITTTGITEVKFCMKDTMFRIFDVGGQRSERRKWIHCFDDVSCVIFIASLSEYNMVLSEDGKTNRTHESLMLFETICNCQYIAKAAMILFLNKTDIFAEKIQQYPLTIAFPEYKGKQTYEESIFYTEQKFLRVRNSYQKHIYVHRTCATDTQSIQFVFDACFDIIFTANMKRSGLF